jgi:hypothetical protein
VTGLFTGQPAPTVRLLLLIFFLALADTRQRIFEGRAVRKREGLADQLSHQLRAELPAES